MGWSGSAAAVGLPLLAGRSTGGDELAGKVEWIEELGLAVDPSGVHVWNKSA